MGDERGNGTDPRIKLTGSLPAYLEALTPRRQFRWAPVFQFVANLAQVSVIAYETSLPLFLKIVLGTSVLLSIYGFRGALATPTQPKG